MNNKYLQGLGCVTMAALALTLIGCQKTTDTETSSDMTNSAYPGPNTTSDLVRTNNDATNAVRVGGDIRRGQYDSNLGTNLHNAAMVVETNMSDMAHDMTNSAWSDSNSPAATVPGTMP